MRWLLFNILFVASCAYAVRKGGPTERLTVAIFICARLATVLVRPSTPAHYYEFQWGIFVVDLITLIAMLAVSTGTQRWWPIWMSGLQGAALASHVVRLSPVVNAFAYFTVLALWAYPMLALLIIATWRTGRRATVT